MPIPKFPAKTHGIGPGLKPFNSIERAIARIPEEASWHLDTVQTYTQLKQPYDGNSLAPCITTGTVLSHPSGLRPLSAREMARLNGFDSTHEFPPRNNVTATDLRRQISNAVPPFVWKIFVKSIIATPYAFNDGKIDEAGNEIQTHMPRATSAFKSPLAFRPSPPLAHIALMGKPRSQTLPPRRDDESTIRMETSNSRKRRLEIDLENGIEVDLNTSKQSIDSTEVHASRSKCGEMGSKDARGRVAGILLRCRCKPQLSDCYSIITRPSMFCTGALRFFEDAKSRS
jgi:C-5 cytosine-specific DNA methylase